MNQRLDNKPEASRLEWIRRVFFPYANREVDRVRNGKLKLVHYTSAEVATSIIKNQQVWMRNSMMMNDFKEIQYGLDCLANAYNKTDAGKRFKLFVDTLWPGLSEKFEQFFNGWQPSFRQDTYLTCVSVHNGGLEDLYGRLSMWRAYGGSTGVALVLNPEVFNSTSQELQAYSSPVLYATQAEFNQYFDELVSSIEKEKEAITLAFNADEFFNTIFEVFRFSVMSTKHPGFKEEREWRVIHSPKIHPSPRLIQSIEVVRGVPQMVYKIPLQDHPESGLVGLSISSFLDKVIIGPTLYPQVMVDAFTQLLIKEGVPFPEGKVVLSDIPLRLVQP